MTTIDHSQTWQTDGKFLRRGNHRTWLRAVTYGPFPPDQTPDPATDLKKIQAAGFNAIRLFTLPETTLLDAAANNHLSVFAGLAWNQFQDFHSDPSIITSAKIHLVEFLKKHAHHPALAGIYLGNEIPADLVRWIGPNNVRETLENLIETARQTAPNLLYAYANYPSTEYLEPANADFSAFNIYLEDPAAFSAYLKRLHNIAGDRPLIISEFGIDSLRNGPEIQASTIRWALDIAHQMESSGLTLFSWTDLWQNNDRIVDDWQFGLTDIQGKPKPALQTCQNWQPPPQKQPPSFTLIICTRNGADRIANCLHAVRNLRGKPHQTIVVDDGSTDATARIVSENFPEILLLSIPPSGLSAARNIGAQAATGDILAYTDDDCEPDPEWLTRLAKAFDDPAISAAGGPNLPPAPRNRAEAIICASPGAPSHVLLDDTRAEHLPGCNIAVRKSAFLSIGGFDHTFTTAGDDVDFCWRLSDANLLMAFVPGAFVWHWRRTTLRGFLKQQLGYGKAEKILINKHPQRFTPTGEARWQGFIYGGGPIRADQNSIIYHGQMGHAGYQSIVNRMLPLRPLKPPYNTPTNQLILQTFNQLIPLLRRLARNRTLTLKIPHLKHTPNNPAPTEIRLPSPQNQTRDHYLQLLTQAGWQPAGPTDPYDLSKNNTRLLIATEYLDSRHKNNLFRIWGNPNEAPLNNLFQITAPPPDHSPANPRS